VASYIIILCGPNVEHSLDTFIIRVLRICTKELRNRPSPGHYPVKLGSREAHRLVERSAFQGVTDLRVVPLPGSARRNPGTYPVHFMVRWRSPEHCWTPR
jgi:hypothetical protein